MKNLTFEMAQKLSKEINRETYSSNPFYLFQNCYLEEKNGETLIFEKEKIGGKNPLLFLPKKKENMLGETICAAYDEDLEIIKKLNIEIIEKITGLQEYVYSTNDWISLEGSNFRDIRKQITKFKKSHPHKIYTSYPQEKILKFIEKWAKVKESKVMSEISRYYFNQELKDSKDNLNLMEKPGLKGIFVEIDGELVGFSLFTSLIKNMWIALMQKTNYHYRGLPQYLYHLKSVEMKGTPYFTTGVGAKDPNLRTFKESLRPVKVFPIYLLKLGN